MQILREWKIGAKWGKIALISFGNPLGPRVLLVHGRQDSAATFIPLLEYLPEHYYYVAVDMPGHGKSDPFPNGVKLLRAHNILPMELVMLHLQWNNFIFIGHSMGCETGLFFNTHHPNRITKIIHLDMGPSLQRIQVRDLPEFFAEFYQKYYDDYNRENFEDKVFSKKEAIESVMRARGFTEAQAEIILSRNLTKVGKDNFKLSWDKRLKSLAPIYYPVKCYCKLFLNAPPGLLIKASRGDEYFYTKGKEDAEMLIDTLEKNTWLKVVEIEGGHDVHFTHPEKVGPVVREFMEAPLQARL